VPLRRVATEGGAFFVRLRFEPDARLDYQFLVDGVAQPDALNPRSIESGAAPALHASELVLPRHEPAYLAHLERVVAYVDSHFSTRTEPESRLHLGTSAGGRAALFAALERPQLFGGAALLSPSLGAALYYYEPYLRGRRAPPPRLRVWLSAGSYEGALCEDTRTLQHYLEDAGLDTQAAYSHEGHSFGTWRGAAVGALRFLLPP
jgi:enterochelin esterase-like enzyme